MALTDKYIRGFLWNVITHLYQNFSGNKLMLYVALYE